jgi:5-methyltetrahydropteroyltriglutamate--homocysteine methyltransferase
VPVVANFRADHVGSLLRPPEIKQARDDFFDGVISRDQLTAIEDRCILEALAMQRQTGISVLSDGEFRREAFSDAWNRVLAPFREQLPPDAAPVPNQPGGQTVWRGPPAEVLGTEWRPRRAVSPVIVRKIALAEAERLTAHESAFLQAHAGAAFKVTMPGVGQVLASSFKPGETDRVYDSRDEMVSDIVAIMRREIVSLIDEGVPYIQLDSLRYVIQIADPTRRQALVDAGYDPEAELDATIAADNASIDGIDRRATVIGLHMCRGNNRSRWISEGSYDAVAERTFSQLHVDRLLLEFDDERSGGFEVLRYVPRDKIVVLGIVSSKLAALESVDFLCRRIEDAARYFPLERLALSPQCGFASSIEGNLLTQDEQKRKLEVVAETARKVWGDA